MAARSISRPGDRDLLRDFDLLKVVPWLMWLTGTIVQLPVSPFLGLGKVLVWFLSRLARLLMVLLHSWPGPSLSSPPSQPWLPVLDWCLNWPPG